MSRSALVFGLLASTAACSTSSNGGGTSTTSPSGTSVATDGTFATTSASTESSGASVQTSTSPSGAHSTTTAATTGQSSTSFNDGSTAATTSEPSESTADNTRSDTSEDSTVDGSSTAEVGSSSGTSAETGAPSVTESPNSSGVESSSDPVPVGCIGNMVPSANPKSAGPFTVAADKNVGPLAGVVPDPIYGDQQQRYNVYRPANLADSEYCHPILIWANGYRDNPEQNAPDCVVDSGANRWCGQYLPLMNHLASHGFVVVASLSTATAEGDPLPTIAGLDWILEQAEDTASPYYHRLDTANIGQLGHSYGGMSTCMSAAEPRYKALATICGTRALTGVHTPMMFFCGGNDTTVECAGVRDTFLTVTDQPAFFINERGADHGSWVYGGAGGVSLSASAAWFRAHLMGDTESRKYFYGANCAFCSDNRVEVEQNALMAQ